MFKYVTRLFRRERSPAPAAQSALQSERKAGYPGGPFIAFSPAGHPIWSPRSYSAFAREGYAANPVAFRCIRMIAESAASVPIILYDGRTEIDKHPLLDVLATPNPYTDGTSFFETWYSHLLLSGNAYLEAVDLDGLPVSVQLLRPDRMSVVPDARGWPKAYLYKTGTVERRYDQAGSEHPPILHLSLFHPTNDHYGMSPLEAAAVPIDVHNASAAWSKSLLDNAARPSGALVYKGEGMAQLTDDQFARLKSDLTESFAGAHNAGRPILLEGGLDWKPLSFSASDMDFLNTKHSAARDIALALGVPPMLLGIPGDNTYANYREANLAFWRQTVVPLATKTMKALSGFLGRRYEGDLHLGPDLDAVPALGAEREALWSRLSNADFLTRDEKREAVGYGVETVSPSEVIRMERGR